MYLCMLAYSQEQEVANRTQPQPTCWPDPASVHPLIMPASPDASLHACLLTGTGSCQ
jgi:hypothetical protein